MSSRYDMIIIGGGPAGLTAAIYANRANLRTLLLEQKVCGGLVNSTHVVENYPSQPSINGMELMEKFRNHAESLGVEIREVVEVDSLDLAGEEKFVATDEGRFSCSTIVLATGRIPKPLPIETEFDQVHYCAICDGSGYRGKDVLVVGGGNSGVEESLYLLSLGVNSILLVEELDHLPAGEKSRRRLMERPEATIMTSTAVRALNGNGRVEAAVLYDASSGRTIEKKVAGVFVYIGQEPKTRLFQGQVDLDDYGYILTNEIMETNLPGVYAAGDVIRKKYRQITTAVSDGTIAALSAVEYLGKRRQ